MNARAWGAAALLGAWALSAGCANTPDTAALVDDTPETPSFTPEDASTSPPDAGLLSYCPSSHCPTPFTTCPGSRFLCDVNLLDDPANCGACGHACPEEGALGGKYQCANGQCVLTCTTTPTRTADCDGVADNGCEVVLGNDANCSACGDACTDPDKPCLTNTTKNTSKCGCDAGLSYCPAPFSDPCVDIKNADDHCGACGTSCPNEGDAGPAPANAHYGCVAGECGHLKCDAGYDDCDGDLNSAGSNGCETSLVAETSCGSCKNVCDPGQSCALDYQTKQLECMCSDGKVDCGSGSPFCVDITSDPSNCGGCGIWCGLYYIVGGVALSHYVPGCSAGSCTFGCEQGWADCNGRLEDGCEVNIRFDPENCGGCGIVCNAAENQACVAGQCALEPCDADGGPTR